MADPILEILKQEAFDATHYLGGNACLQDISYSILISSYSRVHQLLRILWTLNFTFNIF